MLCVGAVVWSLFLPTFGAAQSRQELEEKRKRLLREISVTTELLNKTKRDKTTALDRYTTLQKQITQRERLVRLLNNEIAAAEATIERNLQVVASLQRDIEDMRADYARTVRHAYRRKSLSYPLLFLLSADNLNQAFRRWLFLRKYDRYRKAQAEAIAQTQQALQHRAAVLEKTQEQQKHLLNDLQLQYQTLSAELREKERLLRALKADEERLQADLKRQQASHEALNATIERIIREEVRRQAARKEETLATDLGGLSPEAETAPERTAALDAFANLTQRFKQSRGHLSWPVQKGYVSRSFGRQKHPTLPNIELDNKGIDIRTQEEAAVRAVYEGVVSGVQYVPGHENTVILQHGDYYTVYSNMVEVRVNTGVKVKGGQVIGKVGKNPISNAPELHFEIWYRTQRLNPSSWLKQ